MFIAESLDICDPVLAFDRIMRFTVCGREPVSMETGYRDGKALVTAVWSFRPGEPEEVRVSYDTNGRGDPPEGFKVEKGAIPALAGVAAAQLGDARNEEGLWGFDGWTDGEEGDWRGRPVLRDTVLTAIWHRIVDEIEVTYEIPRAGEGGALTEVSVPEGAPYAVGEVSLVDGDWESVTRIESGVEYCLCFEVWPADPSVRFLSCEEDGVPAYAGTLRINGIGSEDAYLSEYADEGDGTVRRSIYCTYRFTPEG